MKKEKEVLVPLWEEEEYKICRFCAFAKRVSVLEEVYCEKKKQVVPEDSVCRKYKYDILKKELRRRKAVSRKYNKGDFEI